MTFCQPAAKRKHAGFIFADAGFDVWMGNFRGNTYSRAHVNLSSLQSDYWQFTWDEMAAYDPPAMLNYVLSLTGQPKLNYIGHSMGTMTAFAALSNNASLGYKVERLFALGPVAYLGHVRGLLRLLEPVASNIDKLLVWFGNNEFMPSNFMLRFLAHSLCGMIRNPVCKNVMFLICGHDTHQLNSTRLPVYMKHYPAGTSTKNIMHFVQQMKSKKFQAFDWGSPVKNRRRYGQRTPPHYNAAACKVKTYLFSGTPDVLADKHDVKLLAAKLPHLKGNYIYPTFNHLDFVWGTNAAGLVYDKILKIIQQKNS